MDHVLAIKHHVVERAKLSPAVLPTHIGTPPGLMDKSEFVSEKKYKHRLHRTYFNDKEERIADSSRTTPQDESLYDFPIGTWMIEDDTEHERWRPSPYGIRLFQLRVIPFEHLEYTEDKVPRNIGGRKDDAMRYAEWMREGHMPPPIKVFEDKQGYYEVFDGHRRAWACMLAKKPIRAWVNPLIEITKKNGKKERVGLTMELAREYTRTDVEKSLPQNHLAMMKGRSFPVGTVHDWKGVKYRKVGPNKWEPVKHSRKLAVHKTAEPETPTTPVIKDMVTLNTLNKELAEYGYEMVKNSRDRLWYFTATDSNDLMLFHETIDFHMPLTTKRFDRKLLLNTLIEKLEETKRVDGLDNDRYDELISKINKRMETKRVFVNPFKDVQPEVDAMYSVLRSIKSDVGLEASIHTNVLRGMMTGSFPIHTAADYINKVKQAFIEVKSYLDVGRIEPKKGKKLSIQIDDFSDQKGVAGQYNSDERTIHIAPTYSGAIVHEVAHYLWDIAPASFQQKFIYWIRWSGLRKKMVNTLFSGSAVKKKQFAESSTPLIHRNMELVDNIYLGETAAYWMGPTEVFARTVSAFLRMKAGKPDHSQKNKKVSASDTHNDPFGWGFTGVDPDYAMFKDGSFEKLFRSKFGKTLLKSLIRLAILAMEK